MNFWPFSRAKDSKLSKGYDVVRPEFEDQRRPAYIEHKGEDKQVTTAQRNKIINLNRDLMRNSPESVLQDQQVRVNVVGCVGGKLYAEFGEGGKSAADAVMKFFNKKWCRHAEFTRGEDFNTLLKNVLTAVNVNGDMILVFDDGILTGKNGSGRIRGFEGDEIANVPRDEFEKRFPKTYTQVDGIVLNECGMICGAFVSTSQRGRKVFNPQDGFITLKADPFDDEKVPNWIIVADVRRFNQVRGISPSVSAATTALDLHESRGSEAQAAKLNSKMVYQILKGETSDPGAASSIPGFAPIGAAGAQGSGADGGKEEIDVTPLKNIGAIGINNPQGVKTEIMDTKRPNPNFQNYAQFMAGIQGGVRGLPRVYSTLQVQNSYAGFRGEQKIAEQSFNETKKLLERHVCDWAARCAISRAAKIGIISAALPDEWWDMIAWRWPEPPEVSVKDAEAGRAQKMKNGMTSLRRELGPGEVEKIIAERAKEKALFDAAGLIYPGEETASGHLKDDGPSDEESEGDEDKDNTQGGDNA